MDELGGGSFVDRAARDRPVTVCESLRKACAESVGEVPRLLPMGCDAPTSSKLGRPKSTSVHKLEAGRRAVSHALLRHLKNPFRSAPSSPHVAGAYRAGVVVERCTKSLVIGVREDAADLDFV